MGRGNPTSNNKERVPLGALSDFCYRCLCLDGFLEYRGNEIRGQTQLAVVPLASPIRGAYKKS